MLSSSSSESRKKKSPLVQCISHKWPDRGQVSPFLQLQLPSSLIPGRTPIRLVGEMEGKADRQAVRREIKLHYVRVEGEGGREGGRLPNYNGQSPTQTGNVPETMGTWRKQRRKASFLTFVRALLPEHEGASRIRRILRGGHRLRRRL